MLTFIQRGDGFEQIVGCDLPESQSMFVTGFFHKADKVSIVFPVPGETEVVVHGANCTGLSYACRRACPVWMMKFEFLKLHIFLIDTLPREK